MQTDQYQSGNHQRRGNALADQNLAAEIFAQPARPQRRALVSMAFAKRARYWKNEKIRDFPLNGEAK